MSIKNKIWEEIMRLKQENPEREIAFKYPNEDSYTVKQVYGEPYKVTIETCAIYDNANNVCRLGEYHDQDFRNFFFHTWWDDNCNNLEGFSEDNIHELSYEDFEDLDWNETIVVHLESLL